MVGCMYLIYGLGYLISKWVFNYSLKDFFLISLKKVDANPQGLGQIKSASFSLFAINVSITKVLGSMFRLYIKA